MFSRDEFEEQQAKDLGEFFAQLRYKVRKTQREIGELARASQATITHIELAKTDLRLSTVQKLARVFGYRIEIYFVPVDGGEPVIAKPDPKLRSVRTYGGNTFTLSGPRKKAVRSVKPRTAGPQVHYENEGEFDIDAEMMAMRQRLGVG